MRTVGQIFKKLILPLLLAIILAAMFKPLYMKNGELNFLYAWILIGIPFGMRRMYAWLIPGRSLDLGATVAIWALNFVVGGLIGGVVLAWQILKGIFYLISVIFGRREEIAN